MKTLIVLINKRIASLAIIFSILIPVLEVTADPPADARWLRHAIDDSSRGADGVKLMDVNEDGLQDIATGWEEGDETRVYMHPGYDKVRSKWPTIHVGKSSNVEDAVFCDVDNDGAIDVVSCCEGGTQSIFVHWAPKEKNNYRNADAWKTEIIPITKNATKWMFATPMQVDGKQGVDLIVSSKSKNALIGWLQSPEDPRDLSAWKFHKIYDAGWIMSLMTLDVDLDGDLDIVASDRKGETPGVLWLENPGEAKAAMSWPEHRIGGSGRQVMFLDVADMDDDGRKDIVVAVKPDEIHWYRCPDDLSNPWPVHNIEVAHPSGTGTAKAVSVGDIDGNGNVDIVYSCEHANPPKRGVLWLSYNITNKTWLTHDLGGPDGIKFDRIELLDVDGDNDLDVLTCEESHEKRGLGVFWYENPYNNSEQQDGADND